MPLHTKNLHHIPSLMLFSVTQFKCQHVCYTFIPCQITKRKNTKTEPDTELVCVACFHMAAWTLTAPLLDAVHSSFKRGQKAEKLQSIAGTGRSAWLGMPHSLREQLLVLEISERNYTVILEATSMVRGH